MSSVPTRGILISRHDFYRFKNVHAIGDRANGLVLDAFEVALKDADVKALRPRLEHAQLLADRDIARFGDLGGKFVPLIWLVCSGLPFICDGYSNCQCTTDSCVSTAAHEPLYELPID